MKNYAKNSGSLNQYCFKNLEYKPRWLVMGSQQAATGPIGPRRQMQKGVVGRECPSWTLSPLVLISVSLSYLSIGIVPYYLGTRGVSPIYPL
jgi:hypothetical protein